MTSAPRAARRAHGARFGTSFQLEVKSLLEAVRALIVQLKGFRQAMRPRFPAW
jgi:predicted phage tail protein